MKYTLMFIMSVNFFFGAKNVECPSTYLAKCYYKELSSVLDFQVFSIHRSSQAPSRNQGH